MKGETARMQGRQIYKGKASGKVLKLEQPLSFLGGVEAATGELRVEREGNVKDRVLVFPRGKGSTVGSFVMYDLKVHGNAPAAVINQSAETIVATGAVISDIPMVDSVDVSLIKDGDSIIVDADNGTVELPDVDMVESSSSAILIGDRIVMLHRPPRATSYPGRWSLVAGKHEYGEDPLTTARREIKEETGFEVGEPIARDGVICVRENDRIWKVSMFAFRMPEGSVPKLNRENTEYRLCTLKELEDMELVPETLESVKRMLGSE